MLMNSLCVKAYNGEGAAALQFKHVELHNHTNAITVHQEELVVQAPGT